jgi:phosphoglucomutase
VVTRSGWFAARPLRTGAVYKAYPEAPAPTEREKSQMYARR